MNFQHLFQPFVELGGGYALRPDLRGGDTGFQQLVDPLPCQTRHRHDAGAFDKGGDRLGIVTRDGRFHLCLGSPGGETIGQTVEGLARYPISVRYPREIRDSLEGLRQLPVLTPGGQQITLGTVAQIEIVDGPPMLKTENARPSTWIYVDVRGRDLASKRPRDQLGLLRGEVDHDADEGR